MQLPAKITALPWDVSSYRGHYTRVRGRNVLDHQSRNYGRTEFFYLQFSKADLLKEPFCSVILSPLEALAITVTASGVMQVAVPLSLCT